MSKLSAKQQLFVAAYIGEAKGNATEAARIAGYAHPNKQGPALLVNIGIKTAVEEHLSEVKRQGIANKQNRVDALVSRHKLLEQVMSERAADEWTADVPGGRTGLVVKQLKNVKHFYEPDPDDEDARATATTIELWESAVDTGLLKELREHEKQIAQEVGDWVEKGEHHHTGKDDGPIEFLYREAPSIPKAD